MEEQLITFKTAKLAKEKGFDIPVINYYTSINKYNRKNNLSYSEGYQTERLQYSNWNDGQGSYPTMSEEVECSAPTQSLLQKWLRDKHKIHAFAHPLENLNSFLAIVDAETPSSFERLYISDNEYNKFENALERSLKEGLKLLKDKK